MSSGRAHSQPSPKSLDDAGFGVIWEIALRRPDLKWVRFRDLRHFAATMFASTGTSTKQVMSRGG